MSFKVGPHHTDQPQHSIKLGGVQIARAVAVLAVLIYHLMLLQREYALEEGTTALFDSVPHFLKSGVDIFFTISGFIMVFTASKTMGQPKSARRFLSSRLSKIYPSYWVLTAIMTLYWIVFPNSVNTESGGVNLAASYSLAPSYSAPLVPVAWTLTYELMFYAVFAAFIAFFSSKRLFTLILCWGVCALFGHLALSDAGYLNRSPWVDTIFSPFVLEFCGGCLVGLAYRKGLRPIQPHLALIISTIWFITIGISYHMLGWPESLPTLHRVFLYVFPSALLVYGMANLTITKKWSRMIYIGNASYSIYLVHILVIHALFKFVLPLHDSTYFAIAVTAATLAASLASSLVFYRIIELPLSEMARSYILRVLKLEQARTIKVA